MSKQINTVSADALRAKIEGSLLLAEDRKSVLLVALPTLDAARRSDLYRLLNQEEPIIDAAAKKTVEDAAGRNDTDALKALTQTLGECARTIRKEDEQAERSEEEPDPETFFSNAA